MRRQARELTLQVLFHREFSPLIPTHEFLGLYETNIAQEDIDYAQVLTKGVCENIEKIDQMISASSQHWKINRMGLVDKNILRIAIFENVFFNEKIQTGIVINEAVEIAKKYGTEDSSSFINGILDDVLAKAALA